MNKTTYYRDIPTKTKITSRQYFSCLGAALEELCTESGITPKQLAKKTGCSENKIRRVIKGDISNVTVQQMFDIQVAFPYNSDELLNNADSYVQSLLKEKYVNREYLNRK